VGEIRTWQLVQNYPYRPLLESVEDPQAERRFDELLERERPDLVHLHHLWGWSAGLPARARRAGVPVLMHLHDHWLACPSGGQRFHPDGQICEILDRSRCDDCYARFRSREGRLERLAMRAARHLPRPLPPDLLHRGFAGLPPQARGLLKRINERPADAAVTTADGAAQRRWDILRRALDRVDRFVSPSRDLAERMDPLGIARSRITVVPNGTSLEAAASTPPGVADPARPLELLFLGTPVPHKGAHVVAEAVAGLRGAARLTIHGHEPAVSYAPKLAMPHVELAGPVPRESVAAAIDRADLLCLPSLWPENAPLVLLEARARGRAVLASDLGGVAESACGRLLTAGDVEEWRGAIEGLARDRRALARQTAEVRPPRTLVSVVEDHRELYSATLEHP
jgi:glycosyltransferase involved in cell wall biosynthesis